MGKNMTETNISNAPLAIQFAYFSKFADSWTTDSIQTLEALDSGLANQLSQLQPFLNNDLGDQFNTIWTSIMAAEEASLQSQFVAHAAQQGQSLTHVTTKFPTSGTLWATTVSAIPASGNTPLVPGILTLIYKLPGWDVSFDTGSLTAEWDVSFDVSIVITTQVPILPFSLAFSANAVPSNANLNSDNAVAWAEGTIAGVLNFISFGLVSNPYQSVQSGVDNQSEPVGIAGLNTLSNSLSSAGPEVITYGFTECGFSIANGPTLTLTVTHPLDPGPVLENTDNPQANQQLSNAPTLAASDTEVKPGSAISVVGSNFPVDTMTQLRVEWPNTSSGTPTGAQIKYEIKGSNTATPISVPLPSSFDGVYNYTASSLAAGADYQFLAQCGDVLTWSSWSAAPLTITTAKTNVADLVLQPVNNPNSAGQVIGSADLSKTSTQWNCSGQIPGNTADGTYYLIAELSGASIASTTIIVDSVLRPVLQMIDPTTNTVITDPVLGGGSAFTVRGVYFPQSTVTVTLNGATVGTPNTLNGEFELPLTVPGNPETSEDLPITVTATSGGLSASFNFTSVGAP
jgi:hypothetical protein